MSNCSERSRCALRSRLTGVLLLGSVCIVAPATAQDNRQQIDAETDRVDVRSFVRQRYNHGVPYLEAQALGRDSLPILHAMLKDSAEERYWTTIMLTVGIIGDKSSTDPLIAFIETQFEGEVSIEAFRALLLAPSALGHLAGAGNQKAHDYLSQAARVKTWTDKNVKWSYEKYKAERLGVLMAKVSVNGLGIAGTEQARKVLNDARDNPESDSIAQALESNIREGLARIEKIQRNGRVEVFTGHEQQ